jgi:hypothetical protein
VISNPGRKKIAFKKRKNEEMPCFNKLEGWRLLLELGLP